MKDAWGMLDRVLQILEDFEGLRDPHAEPELEAVKAAIFLEDVFDIRLRDSQIDPASLLAPGAMEHLLSRSKSQT
jgi:hypothetical protein